jgi:hypothetical protein
VARYWGRILERKQLKKKREQQLKEEQEKK